MPPSVLKRWRRRVLLLVTSLTFALGLAELALRLLAPGASFAPGRDREGWTENTATFEALMSVDAELGYLPRPGTMLFDERGLGRDHPADSAAPTGPTRVLWIGDSVTARRFIEREVRRQCPTPFTSLNGGVEGYNATQTLRYYQRVLRPLKPDGLVFTLHHNDWDDTPIVFFDDEHRVHCRALDRQVGGFSPWWFEHSFLYRAVFHLWLSASAPHTGESADSRVREALAGLRDVAADDGIPLTVLLLPPMRPEAEWQATDRQRHDHARTMLRELGMRCIDLLPGLQRGLAAGIDVQQQAGDWMHPSEAVAVHLAAEVLRAGFVPGR